LIHVLGSRTLAGKILEVCLSLQGQLVEEEEEPEGTARIVITRVSSKLRCAKYAFLCSRENTITLM